MLNAETWLALFPVGKVVDHMFSFGGSEARSVEHDSTNNVWINVRSWPSIFNVALAVVMHGLGWNPE